MSWTPHTTQELINAGVDFSEPSTKGVVVLPSNSGSTVYKYNDPVAAMAASGTPINLSTGTAAKEVSQIAANVGASLGSVGAAAGLDVGALEDLIMKNTDKNNAWSAAQAQRQMDFQERMQGIAQEFNASEAAKNRDWQELMSNTAHQREVADLKAAGLNPILSATGGNGASVGSGAAASVGQAQGAKGDTDESGNSALVAIYSALLNAQTQMQAANLSAKTNLQMAEMQKEASMYGSALAAEASIQNAGTAYAATIAGQQNQLQMQREQNTWNADHPSNVYQLGSSIASGIGLTPSTIGNNSSASGILGSLNRLAAGAYEIGQKARAVVDGTYKQKYGK